MALTLSNRRSSQAQAATILSHLLVTITELDRIESTKQSSYHNRHNLMLPSQPLSSLEDNQSQVRLLQASLDRVAGRFSAIVLTDRVFCAIARSGLVYHSRGGTSHFNCVRQGSLNLGLGPPNRCCCGYKRNYL